MRRPTVTTMHDPEHVPADTTLEPAMTADLTLADLEAAVRGGPGDGSHSRIISVSICRIAGVLSWRGSLILADGETHPQAVTTERGTSYIDVTGATFGEVAEQLLALVPGIAVDEVHAAFHARSDLPMPSPLCSRCAP